jgi:hypothetical protein
VFWQDRWLDGMASIDIALSKAHFKKNGYKGAFEQMLDVSSETYIIQGEII